MMSEQSAPGGMSSAPLAHISLSMVSVDAVSEARLEVGTKCRKESWFSPTSAISTPLDVSEWVAYLSEDVVMRSVYTVFRRPVVSPKTGGFTDPRSRFGTEKLIEIV